MQLAGYWESPDVQTRRALLACEACGAAWHTYRGTRVTSLPTYRVGRDGAFPRVRTGHFFQCLGCGLERLWGCA